MFYKEFNIPKKIRTTIINVFDMEGSSAIKFIRDKDLLNEYMTTEGYMRPVYYELDESKLEYCVNLEHNGNRYLLFENPHRTAGVVEVLKVLPDVYDDDTFCWKQNKKYGTLEAKLNDGVFEFYCIYKENGDGVIDIAYAKYQNRHRNKVNIASIDMQDASNGKFARAIDKWKTKLQEDMGIPQKHIAAMRTSELS